ncbi:condensation domain-containing protein [Williamsia phyllosphaerae]|uniref:Acyltransferase papA1 n=1 Tax=Williamsia phyllosphaerae TaxID=885042 RepID=A0ABQ1UZ94_9NOCA|nr:condensation domain-containing protein [Williamsia phyllosphaerae]GGF31459.1 acyltransferase papA1 [Williamsia phyllosphaerae]
MMIDMLSHWQPARGRLVELSASSASLAAAAAAPAHPTPASFLQENHLRGSTATAARGDAHKAYLAATTEVEGHFDADALARAFRRFVARHDGLRSWFDVTDGVVTRHMVALSDIAFEATAVGSVDDYGYLRADDDAAPLPRRFSDHVEQRFSQNANALSWPGFVAGAIVRGDGFTLYYGCDHALSDGISQALVLAEVADLYLSERDGTDVGPFTSAPAGSQLDYVTAERARAQTLTDTSPEVRGWVDIVARHGNRMPQFPLDLGLAPGETAPVAPIKFDVLDAGGAEAFERTCRDHGAKMIGGIIAALAIVDHELAGVDSYFGITALSDRALAGSELSQGWFCRFAPVSFPITPARTFTELVSAAQQGCETGKSLSDVPVHTVLGSLLASGAQSGDVLVTPQLLSYIDFRRFPMAGTAVYDRGMQTTGEGRTSNASMWVNRDDSGVYVGTQTPDTPTAQRRLARYHRRLREVFAAVAADGDHVIATSVTEREPSLARHHD